MQVYLNELGLTLLNSTLKPHFQFHLIMDLNPINPNQRDGRLQPPSTINCMAVESGQVEAPLLVKAQGRRIVVGSNQPQALASCRGSSFFHGKDQGRTDAYPFHQAVQRDDLTLFASDMIDGESYYLPV